MPRWGRRPAPMRGAVLSAVLPWAANSELVPEIKSNGCLFANEKIGNRRRSMRGAQGRASVRRHGDEIGGWALSPPAVELIRAEMLQGGRQTGSPSQPDGQPGIAPG
jgi:hypothetical protein